MTANELADALVDMKGYYGYNEEAATMLRQQQAEIEALKGEAAQLKHMNKNWQISENILLLELEKLQSRELTDEEIDEVYAEYRAKSYKTLARAYLRKASEK